MSKIISELLNKNVLQIYANATTVKQLLNDVYFSNTKTNTQFAKLLDNVLTDSKQMLDMTYASLSLDKNEQPEQYEFHSNIKTKIDEDTVHNITLENSKSGSTMGNDVEAKAIDDYLRKEIRSGLKADIDEDTVYNMVLENAKSVATMDNDDKTEEIDKYLMKELNDDATQTTDKQDSNKSSLEDKIIDDILIKIDNEEYRNLQKQDIVNRRKCNLETKKVLAELAVEDYLCNLQNDDLLNVINERRDQSQSMLINDTKETTCKRTLSNGNRILNMQLSDDIFNIEKILSVEDNNDKAVQEKRADNLDYKRYSNTPRPDTPRPSVKRFTPVDTLQSDQVSNLQNTPKFDNSGELVNPDENGKLVNPSKTVEPAEYVIKPVATYLVDDVVSDLDKLQNISKLAAKVFNQVKQNKKDGQVKVEFKTPMVEPPEINAFFDMTVSDRERLLQNMYVKAKKTIMNSYTGDLDNLDEINKLIREEMDRLVELYKETH